MMFQSLLSALLVTCLISCQRKDPVMEASSSEVSSTKPQLARPLPKGFVVLNGSYHKEIGFACSGLDSITPESGWEPTSEDIERVLGSLWKLDKQLQKWASLRQSGAISIAEYNVQLVPVVSRGEKVFYVGAFDSLYEGEGWKEGFFNVCTLSLSSYWKTVYYPELDQFGVIQSR